MYFYGISTYPLAPRYHVSTLLPEKTTRPYTLFRAYENHCVSLKAGYKTFSSEGGYVGTLGVGVPVILLCVHLLLK